MVSGININTYDVILLIMTSCYTVQRYNSVAQNRQFLKDVLH